MRHQKIKQTAEKQGHAK